MSVFSIKINDYFEETFVNELMVDVHSSVQAH